MLGYHLGQFSCGKTCRIKDINKSLLLIIELLSLTQSNFLRKGRENDHGDLNFSASIESQRQ